MWSLAPFALLASVTAAANTAWTVCNRKLLKDGQLFFIRGVNYQPVPIDTWSGLDLLLQPELWKRDLKILRNMNVNSAKIYQISPGHADAHNAYLDAAYNNGQLPIYTMFSIWVDKYPMSSAVAIDSMYFQAYVASYKAMAKEVACHPGTMGYVIGGENNGIWEVSTQPFWAKFNQLSQAVRQGIAEANCPIPAPKILTTNFLDDYGATIIQGEKYGADVDIWGVNIYDNRFDAQKMLRFNQITSKPYLFAEYGVPFASNREEAIGTATWDVGKYLISLARIQRNSFLGKDPSGTSIIVGGYIFEYTDEWWKHANPAQHDYGYEAGPFFPLGIFAEEYFGIFSVSRGNGLNILTPRHVVAQLASLWAVPIDGQPFNCNSPIMPSTPPEAVSTVTVCGKDVARGISSFTDDACNHGGGLGCQGVVGTCRYCQRFGTSQSSPYLGCPPSASSTLPPEVCTNTSFICSNGVAMKARERTCEFDECPVITCDADPVMLVRGVGMVYDSSCLGSSLVGCDLLRPGCRYCSPPNSQTAFPACPTLPTTTPCTTTLSDLNMGLSLIEDGSCMGGGIGCDATRPTCRYCKMRETPQSKRLNVCPGVNIGMASNFEAMGDDAEESGGGRSTNSRGLIVVAFVVVAILLGVLFAKVLRNRSNESRRRSQLALHTPTDPNNAKMSLVRNLVKYPNRVKDMQALFNKNPHLVGAENPTFLKGTNDSKVFYFSIALMGVGTVQTLRGFWNMSWGVGKKE